MSIIFGMLHREGDMVPEQKLVDLACPTRRWAPDGTFIRVKGQIGMGFQPYYTHERSSLESKPAVDGCGNMVVIDGRLDNHKQLCELLDLQDPSIADSQIVLAAFRRWREDSFVRFVGDWSLALWDHSNRSLYLARDHAGTRSLYWGERDGHLLWSTFLETFFANGESYSLDKMYARYYLACQPTCNRTPYREICAVPPAHYVVADGQRTRRKAYWKPSGETISYKTDTEYEEHFLALFRRAVERRCGAGSPMLIHLSGGMDSSSIVCLADEIERERCSANPVVHGTLSYFDSSEPDWDEEPYVAVVESQRRKRGIHLELLLSARTFTAPSTPATAYLLPGLDSSSLDWEQKVLSVAEPKGVRVFVTGNGGDEVLGGVPTPLPELADYLVARKFGLFFEQAKRWCLANRSALLSMVEATASYLVDLYWRTDWECAKVPPWINGSPISASTVERPRKVYSEAAARMWPSDIENERTWWRVLECLPHLQPGILNRYEYRYPYLDRDLIDFLFSVPREQLVRPGRRRSLMRRSLKDIVPEKILERKRKAFCARGPLLAVARAGVARSSLLKESKAAACGVVDKRLIEAALQQVASGEGIEQIGALMRLLSFESWVSRQVESGMLRLPGEATADCCLSSRQ